MASRSSLLDVDEDAVRKELPDLCEWMLATGVRIGEALAVSCDEVDLAAGTVQIEYTLIGKPGRGRASGITGAAGGALRRRGRAESAVVTLSGGEGLGGGLGELDLVAQGVELT